MDLEIRQHNETVILTMQGQMLGSPDATRVTEKLHQLIEEGKTKFIINLTHVERMNSSGLGILIAGLNTVRSHNGDLKLLNLGVKVRELLRITKLDRIFESFENEDDAIASFS